jgi:hypothetical protein
VQEQRPEVDVAAEVFQPRVRDVVLAQVEGPEVGEALEVRQPLVRYAGSSQVQFLEFGEILEVLQPRVRHRGGLQEQPLEAGNVLEVLQVLVRRSGSGEVHGEDRHARRLRVALNGASQPGQGGDRRILRAVAWPRSSAQQNDREQRLRTSIHEGISSAGHLGLTGDILVPSPENYHISNCLRTLFPRRCVGGMSLASMHLIAPLPW